MSLDDYTITEFESLEMLIPTEAEAEKIKELEQERDLQFFSVLPVRQKVSISDFLLFIRNYPRPLKSIFDSISEPPHISYYDEAISDSWRYSIVASRFIHSNDPKDYFYVPESEQTGTILVNHEEYFNSKVVLSPKEIIKINTEYDKKIAEMQRKFSGRKLKDE